jgi:hypothetical protein
MWWLLGIIAVIVLLAYPATRVLLLGAGAILAVVLAATYLTSSREEAAAKTRIAVSELEFVDVRLQKQSYGMLTYNLVGRVKNHSPRYSASDFTLLVTFEDCVDDTTCDVVWQGQESPLVIDVPPGQARDFELYGVGDSDVRLRGKFQWYYRVVAVSGRRPS